MMLRRAYRTGSEVVANNPGVWERVAENDRVAIRRPRAKGTATEYPIVLQPKSRLRGMRNGFLDESFRDLSFLGENLTEFRGNLTEFDENLRGDRLWIEKI